MYTVQKSSNGLTLIPVETRLLSERKVFLEGEITADSAGTFVKTVMHLVHEDPEKPIDVYINSPGGSVNDAGLMIYDYLKALRTEVNLHCTGIAASMAAILLAGGAKGHRFIWPHGSTMIHQPHLSGGVGGNAAEVMQTAEILMKRKRMIVELLSGDTGRSAEEIEAAISFDNYMSAEEAVAFGLCDAVETPAAG